MLAIREPQWFFTYGLVIALAGILISYFWVDIPLAEWAHVHHLRQYKWLHTIQRLPELFPYMAFASIIIVCLHAYWGETSYAEKAFLYVSLSYVVSRFFAGILKIICARTWPQTWVDHNPSWLTDGVYGFFWFIDAPTYQSFPSGHSAAIFAVASMFCFFYQSMRAVCIIACALVVIGLIGNYYHFLSDIIAGAYVGIATTLFVIQARKHPDEIYSAF